MLRILVNHPDVDITFVNSSSNAGNYVYEVHTDLFGDTDLQFTNELSTDVDVLFLCVGHGDARKFLEANAIPDNVKIIDLSQDFRLNQKSTIGSKSFVYGLPELCLSSKQLRCAFSKALFISSPPSDFSTFQGRNGPIGIKCPGSVDRRLPKICIIHIYISLP